MSKVSHPEGEFVWVRGDARGRNAFVRFTRRFDWNAPFPAAFPLHLFADTRYRLRVNGAFVGAGPACFVTRHPEYDTHDLAPLLQRGRNLIEVEVNFFGASSYQTMPDGRPGFWASGGGGGIDLTTPGDWQGEILHAWRSDSPLFSFALNPVEICDTRLLDRGEPAAIEACRGPDAPWGPLNPYSGVPLEFPMLPPSKVVLAARLLEGGRRYCFMSHDNRAAARLGNPAAKPWVAFATWIKAGKAARVALECGWSDLFLNGTPLAIEENIRFTNHCVTVLELKEGWNLLAGKLCVLSEFWAYCLGVPDQAGISLHARRDASCSDVFAISPVSPDIDSLTLPGPLDPEAPAGWHRESGSPPNLTPSRMMALDKIPEDAVRELDFRRWSEVSSLEGPAATWCFEFEGEFLGYPLLDVEAPPGTILDIAFSDWLHPSGCIDFYRSSPYHDTADRFVLSGGRQTVELFHPRGGRYMQATLRSPVESAALALHSVRVRLRQTIHRDRTEFQCGDPAIEWMWRATMRTQLRSTDEAYIDCPWRERGNYIGDALVCVHIDQILHADPRTARRGLRQFAHAALPDGQLSCCAPSWLRKPHEDYTLLWITALHDHWAFTGDLQTVANLWPTIEGIWASPSWETHSSGLWSLHGARQFVDWGVLASEREGDANACINLFRLEALRQCAAMAEALGRGDAAADLQQQASKVEAALFKVLWDEDRGCLRASEGAATEALHANVLALCFSAGPRERRVRILDYIEPKLLRNLDRALHGDWQSGNLELYFFHFLLPGLAAHDRPDLAEQILSSHYGHLQSQGPQTLVETLHGLSNHSGSACHPWSGAGAIYAARHILGIRLEKPGDPDNLVCAPLVHGIDRASGRIAHPKGWIEVEWKGEDTLPAVSAPEGVQVRRLPVRRAGQDAWGLQRPAASRNCPPSLGTRR